MDPHEELLGERGGDPRRNRCAARQRHLRGRKPLTAPAGESPRFGKYLLVSRLGMGGMAEVFKAQSSVQPNVVVAIKRILPQYSNDQKLVSMLVNEARLSLGLSHPNIVPVLDFGVVDGTYFIAMEYIRGKDLKSIMIRCKTRETILPVPMAIHIVVQILRGLDFAHHKRDHYGQPLQIVHRDISPQNIMISLQGQVKVLDFGIAKASSRSEQTQDGILKGKFSYMSPEQAHGENVDHRSDIFSAGIILWELLTLESYYNAETDISLLRKVRDGVARDPVSINPAVPKPLSAILMQALQKKARKRFQTAGEFADELEEYLQETFGEVSEPDVAAFVRNLFGITSEELVKATEEAIRAAPARVGELGKAVSDSAPRRKTPPAPIPFRPRQNWRSWVPSKEAVGSGISFLLLALLLALSLHRPPMELLRAYDAWVIRQIERGHAWINKSSAAPSATIDLYIPSSPDPGYALQVSPDAQQALDETNFETYERLRNRTLDLAADPFPPSAEPFPQRPGLWSIVQSGYQILYSVDRQLRSVTVEKILK